LLLSVLFFVNFFLFTSIFLSVRSPSLADHPLRPATDRCPGRPLPHQLANRPRAPPRTLTVQSHYRKCDICGISHPFGQLSPARGQVTHVLLSRSPLTPKCPFDLHVLGTPPAFILSQDQTLHRNCRCLSYTLHVLDSRRSLGSPLAPHHSSIVNVPPLADPPHSAFPQARIHILPNPGSPCQGLSPTNR